MFISYTYLFSVLLGDFLLNSNLENDTYKYYDSIATNTEIKISHKTKIKKMSVIYVTASPGVASMIIDFENNKRLLWINGYSNYFAYDANGTISSYPVSHCGVQYKLLDNNTLSIIPTLSKMTKVHIFIE